MYVEERTSASDQDVNDFLLAEYEMLREYRRDAIQLQEHRLSTLLLVVGGTVSLIGIALQSHQVLKDYMYLLPFTLGLLVLCVFVLGYITFERMMLRGAEISLAAHGIDRIRARFLTNHQEIAPHLAFGRLGLALPSFASQGQLAPGENLLIGLPNIVAMLNSFVLAIGVATLIRVQAEAPVRQAPMYGTASFVVIWLLHYLRYRYRVRSLRNWYRGLSEGMNE